MGIEVRRFDPADPAQVRAVWEVGRAADAERPYSTYPPWEVARTFLTSVEADRLEVRWLAWDGGEAVGSAQLSGSEVDNTGLGFALVSVPPERRLEGIGSRLLEHLEAAAADLGRPTLTSEVFAPVDATSAALGFALARGYEVDLEDGVKVADLQATRHTWPALAAEAAPHHRGYRLETAWSPLPDRLVEAYCEVDNRFYELAPSGSVEREAETMDLARFRAREELFTRAGRHELVTVALDGEGRAVALSALVIGTATAHRAQQGGTIVLPGHRGHRLGLATKLANHRALVARFPAVEWVVTYNADVNTAMNAVNDRLGFRVVERCVEVVKQLDAGQR